MALSNKGKWVRKFVISETARHEKNFTLYKITSIIFMKKSPEVVSKISVWKRYRDFRKLYTEMKLLHLKLQIKESFPIFSKRKIFGRFDKETIEQRRSCALQLLEFIGNHNDLYTSEIFMTFFESNLLCDHFSGSCHSLNSSASEEDDRSAVDHNINNRSEDNKKKYLSEKSNLPKFVCLEKVYPTSVNGDCIDITDTCNTDLNGKRDVEITNVSNDIHLNFEEEHFNSTKKSENFLYNGTDLMQFDNLTQYVLIAAAHMNAAFRHEAIAEYEEAFAQYKLGTSHLIAGIHNEKDGSRKLIIEDKITKYLQRAERLYNRHLNCNIPVLCKPMAILKNYKVVKLMGSLMLVQDVLQDFLRIIKTVEIIDNNKEDVTSYILHGKVPFMNQLYACAQTDATVFLILEYISRGKLWDYMTSQYKLKETEEIFSKTSHHATSSNPGKILQKRNSTSTEFSHLINDDFCSLQANLTQNDSSLKYEPDTVDLLQNAKKLLQSINATLKRSDSITHKLDKSYSYLNNKVKQVDDNISYATDTSDNIEIGDEMKELTFGDKSDFVNSFYFHNTRNHSNCSKKPLAADDNTHQLKEINKLNKEHANIDSFINEKPLWHISENVVKIWAAEILLALEALHHQNVIISDLKPDNILIDSSGHICMTYVVPRKSPQVLRLKRPYSSPELCMLTPPISMHTSADIWSFGVLLYEIITGFDFESKHPGYFHKHSTINIPEDVSESAKTLLCGILKYHPSERMTIPEIKQHPFFYEINWLDLLSF